MLSMNLFLRAAIFSLTVAVLAGSVLEAQEANPQGGRPEGGQRGGRGPGGGFPGGGFPGGGRMDKATLLGIAQVQKELEIGEDQLFFVKELVASQREKSSALRSSLGDFRQMSDEERTKAFADMQAKREKQSAEADAEIEAFLSEDQRTRLDQISVQVRGTRALSDDDVATKLGVTDSQKEQFKTITDGQREEMRTVFESLRGGNQGGGDAGGNAGRGRGNFDSTAMRTKMEELTKKTDAKILDVLTADQKAKFAAMKGKAFELDRSALFGGGRGGAPGGDRRRPGGDGGGRPARPAAE